MNALIKEKGGTFLLNKTEPIHRWYSYVEGYASCLIAEELKKHLALNPNIETIYDPFCGTGTTSSHNTEADIELDKPSVTITENNTLGKDVSDIESEKNSSDNSDDRIIDSGFWVNELKTDNGMVWKYTPLISPKVAGVFDCEDFFFFFFLYVKKNIMDIIVQMAQRQQH